MSTHKHYTGENRTVLEHAKRKSENTPSRRKIWPCELSFAADCMLPVIYCRAVFLPSVIQHPFHLCQV